VNAGIHYLTFTLTFLIQNVSTGQEPFLCTGQGFLTMNVDGRSTLVELRIDPYDGVLHFDTINSDMGIFINSVGFNPVDRFIYGIDPVRYILYRIDAKGQARKLEELPLDNSLNYLAGDISADGRYLFLLGATAGIEGFDRDLVRIDLADPSYKLDVIPFSNTERIRMFDLAIDQGDSIAYGFDSSNDRLCTFDLQSGEILTRFPKVSNVETIGAIYFDAFGRLFGFGSVTGPQNTLFEIDVHTGRLKSLASGLPAQSIDGCSCSYSLDLEKRATPRDVVTCDSILFTYEFANRTGFEQTHLSLFDSFPHQSVIRTIRFSGASGIIVAGPGASTLHLEDVSLPRGQSTIEVLITVMQGSKESYGSQALLNNLPEIYGLERRSDDPDTPFDSDETLIMVQGLPSIDTTMEFGIICNSIPLIIDGPVVEGASYLWSTGEDQPQLTVASGGEYELRVSVGCDTSLYIYDVTESKVEIVDETMSKLGDDSLWIAPVVEHQLPLLYQWSAEAGIHISCPDCDASWIHGVHGGEVKFIARDELGCADSSVFLFESSGRDFYIPNAFTPNGDGINDHLEFFLGNGSGEIQVMIFDRFGKIIYEGRGAHFVTRWNGSIGSDEAPEAVYVWLVEWIDRSGRRRHASGEVTLIR